MKAIINFLYYVWHLKYFKLWQFRQWKRCAEDGKKLRQDALHHVKLNFRFKTLGSYDSTRVELKISIPFRQLQLFYLLPHYLLTSYYGVSFQKRPHLFSDVIDHSKIVIPHLKELEEFFPLSKVKEDMQFPSLMTTGKNEPPDDRPKDCEGTKQQS